MWKYKIFINKIDSKFFCTFGKGIFGTTYITSIKLIEAAVINIPGNTDLYSTFPFRKRSLTKKNYSFLNILIPLLFTSGIGIFSFGIFLLYIAHIDPQNSDVRLLKYIELYKFIGVSGIISGIAHVIISIFLLIKFIRKK